MKFKKLLVLLIGSSLLFTSCENFFNGNLIKEELDSLIDYANAPYADITISSTNAATESIIPAAGNYKTQYKVTDKINLSFVPSQNFQFVKWKALPSDSVAFDNPYSLSVTATIQNTSEQIFIEPEVYIKPTVSFAPKNGSVVEKNTPIVLTFSHPLEVTLEDLNKITIMGGGISYNNNFYAPAIDETKTVVTFIAKEDNLINFSEETKDITVSVPKEFYYLADGIKILFQDEVHYTYTVNNQTLTKLVLNYKNQNTSAGSLNLNGEYKHNIGQKQNILFNILQEYAFIKWQVKNTEGKELLTAEYSQFFDFEDVNSNNTNIIVKNMGSGFVIEPLCQKRAQAIASTPVYEKSGVDRGSDIEVLFDQDISESSIYWTEEELLNLKGELEVTQKYTFGSTVNQQQQVFEYLPYIASGKMNKDGKQLFYAYAIKTDTGSNRYFKNIEIKKRGTSESLLNGNYFSCPYLKTPSILVIPTYKEDSAVPLPEYADVEFTIQKGFVNTSGVEIARTYSGCYHTNGKYDIEGPVIYNNSYITELKGYRAYYNTNTDMIWVDDDVTVKSNSIFKVTYEDINNANTIEDLFSKNVFDAKKIIIDNIKITDASGISELILTLTPVANKIYPNQSDKSYKVVVPYAGEKEIECNTINSKTIEFDLSGINTEGVYEVKISAVDIIGHECTYPFEVLDKATSENATYTSPNINVFCVVDNIYSDSFSFEKPSSSPSNDNSTGKITGTKGYYCWMMLPAAFMKTDSVVNIIELLRQGYFAPGSSWTSQVVSETAEYKETKLTSKTDSRTYIYWYEVKKNNVTIDNMHRSIDYDLKQLGARNGLIFKIDCFGNIHYEIVQIY